MATKKKPQTIDWKKLIIALLLPFAAGAIGSIFTSSSIEQWYVTLEKPFFNPPNWVFGPVWTLLYLMQGIAFYLILVAPRISKERRTNATNLFVAQIIVNTFWSLVFFGMELPWLALIDIVILWALIYMTIKAFKDIQPQASYLLWPYLAWVTFATILNLAIALLN